MINTIFQVALMFRGRNVTNHYGTVDSCMAFLASELPRRRGAKVLWAKMGQGDRNYVITTQPAI